MTDDLPAPRLPLPPPPAWWADLQARFGAALHLPLAVEGGAFVPPLPDVDPAVLGAIRGGGPGVALSAPERFAVYHRQVWTRWFHGLQSAHPLTVAALGPWRFNQLAALHLARRPPRARDVDAIADGFVDLVRRGLAPQDPDPAVAAHLARAPASPDAIADALDVDEAQRRAFFAPWPPPWALQGTDVAAIWDQRVQTAPGLTAIVLREPHDGAPALLVGRTEHGTHRTPVPRALAALVRATQETTWGEAVTATAAALPAPERDALARALPAWIARGVRERWWVGLA